MTSSIITFLPESELCNTDVPQHNSRYYLNLIYAVILSPPQIQVCITILLHYSILWSAFPTPEKISLSIIILPIGIFLFTNTYLGQRLWKNLCKSLVRYRRHTATQWYHRFAWRFGFVCHIRCYDTDCRNRHRNRLYRCRTKEI